MNDMYCKCKDKSFPDFAFFCIGQIYQCYWYDNEHTIMSVTSDFPFLQNYLIDTGSEVILVDFLRCFDCWE